MRDIIELNKGWKYSRAYNGDEDAFNAASAEASFPLCDSSPASHHILRGSIKIPGSYSGGGVYLCLSDLWGECELFVDKKRRFTRSCAGATAYFDVTDFVRSGEESVFTLLAEAYGGSFAVSGIRLILMSKSHFYPFDGTDCGITLRAEKREDTVLLHVSQRVVNPINYDIASYIVTDSLGRAVGSAAAKPSQSEVTVELKNASLWNGPHDTAGLMLTAGILRDSTVLDMVQLRFGVRFPEIRGDGFFYLNGVRMPVSGMAVTRDEIKRVSAERLMALANELGANAFKLPASPESRALIEACDREGFAVWLDTQQSVCGAPLTDCIRQFSSHPSVLFVNNPPDAAADCGEPSQVCGGLLCVPDSGFAEISDSSQAAALSGKITAENHVSVCVTPNDADTHERIWAQLCSRAGLFAFFVHGLFSCEAANAPGIGDCEPTDAFYFYKSCFSAVPFVKIIPCEPQGKYADIKCCSNEACLSLTVNGRGRKKYTGTLTKGGLVVFGSVFLPSKENIVRVTGEKSADETEIIVTRKGK